MKRLLFNRKKVQIIFWLGVMLAVLLAGCANLPAGTGSTISTAAAGAAGAPVGSNDSGSTQAAGEPVSGQGGPDTTKPAGDAGQGSGGPDTGDTDVGVQQGQATAMVGTSVPANSTQQPPDVRPTQTPIPTLPGGLSPTELKYRVLAEFPDFFYCDPDYYPLAREDEQALALQRFPEIQTSGEIYDTILAHNDLAKGPDLTNEQKLLVYREYKKLSAILFELVPEGYRFQIQSAKQEGEGEQITGTIDGQGKITVEKREPATVTCPICLAAGTLIDTPSGAVPVESLRPGMLVWTLDLAGRRVAQPVSRVGKTVVPASHQVVRLALADGRQLWVSPGHPTADGRRAGDLRVGDLLDGAQVIEADRVHYTGLATYDLRPSGETGFYWANGILISSTLK